MGMVILHFCNMSQCWKVDKALGYVRRRVIDKEYLDGGYNVFGEKLQGFTRDVVAETLRYQLGDALYHTKDLQKAQDYIAERGLIQVLNIH